MTVTHLIGVVRCYMCWRAVPVTQAELQPDRIGNAKLATHTDRDGDDCEASGGRVDVFSYGWLKLFTASEEARRAIGPVPYDHTKSAAQRVQEMWRDLQLEWPP